MNIINWNEKKAADVLNHMAKDLILRYGLSPDAIGIHAMKYAANRLNELTDNHSGNVYKQIDIIKQMNVEEMTLFIVRIVNCGYCPAENECSINETCHKTISKWFESEVSDE